MGLFKLEALETKADSTWCEDTVHLYDYFTKMLENIILINDKSQTVGLLVHVTTKIKVL